MSKFIFAAALLLTCFVAAHVVSADPPMSGIPTSMPTTTSMPTSMPASMPGM